MATDFSKVVDASGAVIGDPNAVQPLPNPVYDPFAGEATTGFPVGGDTAFTAMPEANAQIVPGLPQTVNQMNVADFAGQLVGDPSLFMMTDDPSTPQNESMYLQDQNTAMDPNAAGTNLNAADPRYAVQADQMNVAASTVGTDAATQGQVVQGQTNTYDVATATDRVDQSQMEAATGQLSEGAIIDDSEVAQADIEAIAAGQTALGESLDAYASQSIAQVIDTSTVSGKLLAQQLGEGNYTDYKATVQGQMQILSDQFVDPVTGEPTIPTWAAGVARNVSRIAAFKGVTGTAATSAMAQAIVEASLPIAQADASFFQTVTLQNLNNRQQSTINKANVLSKLELANLDNRMAAAVQNSKNFLQMDLTNLANEQQERVINTQARVQAVLEDAKQQNAQRLFTAQSQNDMDMYYDNLNASIEQFNTSQLNALKQFDVQQENSVSMFNSEMENQRQQFYQNMQYNIDISNAKWRQTVTLTEDQQNFEAAATDVKNMVGVSLEQLNQIWDRSDALLDYLWRSSESELDRQNKLVLAKLNADAEVAAADAAGEGSIMGAIAGAGSSAFFNWAFGV